MPSTAFPVFDQDYITLLSRFLSEDAIGTKRLFSLVGKTASRANGPGVFALLQFRK